MQDNQVPPEKLAGFNDWWDLAQFTTQQVWQTQNTIFKQNNKGDAKYFTLMFMKDQATKKYTFLVADVKATFHVADDIFIWQKTN